MRSGHRHIQKRRLITPHTRKFPHPILQLEPSTGSSSVRRIKRSGTSETRCGKQRHSRQSRSRSHAYTLHPVELERVRRISNPQIAQKKITQKTNRLKTKHRSNCTRHTQAPAHPPPLTNSRDRRPSRDHHHLLNNTKRKYLRLSRRHDTHTQPTSANFSSLFTR